jgi:periplasmic protein CpxP/Spy
MRTLLIAVAAGAALVTGVGALARTDALDAWHHMVMGGGAHGSADLAGHIDHMLQHLYVELEATDAQKAQIEPLVKQALSDLQPLHAQLKAAHEQALQAVTHTPVDRAALEAARVTHLQLADQASKRALQLIADVGDVLTPTQRTKLADHLAKM